MTCHRPYPIVSLLALGAMVLYLGVALAGDGNVPKDSPESDPLAALLAQRGYFAVPLDWTDPLRPIVHGAVNERQVSFLIDTAANKTSLDSTLVDSLKLPTLANDKTPRTTFREAKIGTVSATVEMLKFGEARLPKCVVSVGDVKSDKESFEGIIGDNILTPNHALFDLASGKLFLRRPGAAPPASFTDELAAYFKAERYVEVRCSKRAGYVPYVRCKIGDHDLSLILDTGARNSMLDRGIAERIGVKLPAQPVPATAASNPIIVSLPAPVFLGGNPDLELPTPNPIVVNDFSTLNRGLEQLGLPRADGLLGVNALLYFSAVIDYTKSEPRLYLIDPTERDGKLLNGEWVGQAVEFAGKSIPADDVEKYRLAIVKNRFDLQLGGDRRLVLEFGDMCPDPDLKWFDLYSDGPAGKQSFPTIYEVSRDRLRVCLPFDLQPGQKSERAKAFKSLPGTPYGVFTFRRVKKP